MEEDKNNLNNEKKEINKKTSKSKKNSSSVKKDNSSKKVEKTIDKKEDVEQIKSNLDEEKITIDFNSLKKKDRMVDAITYIVTFLLFNIRWIEYRYEIFGYKSSQNITIFQKDMFDLSFLLGIAKVFGIICVILFFIILIDSFIDLEYQFKNLKKYNLKNNLPLIYYGSYIACLTFTLFGVLFTKNVYFTIGYIISALVIIICINIVFNKKIEVIKKDE